MKTVEVTIAEDGVLKIPAGVSLPSQARLAVLVLDSPEVKSEPWSGVSIAALAQQSGTLDFLNEEPEIYRDQDILPGRANPRFRK